VLVDFPPDELLKRLAEGKVYVQDTAARAVESFFKPQNLTALRELALRRAAERVDADLIERMQAQAIEGPWAAGERILACIGPDSVSPEVVRTAKRLADLMDAPWSAVTVERPGGFRDDASRQRVDDAIRLAESLGAGTTRLVGNDLPAEVLRHARFENVTQIVVGRSHGGFLRELLRRSLPHELVRRADDIAIHLVTAGAERSHQKSLPRVTQLSWQPMPYAWATVSVAMALGAGKALTALTPLPNLSMIFMLAVLFTALQFGMWPAIYASALAFLTFNFFFIEPLYTLTIAEPHELLALSIFLIIAVTASALAGRVREQAQVAAARVRATRRLYEFTRRLSGLATLDAVAEGAASEINASLARATVVLLDQDGDLVLTAAWPPEDSLDTASLTAARWAFSHNEAAGADTATLPIVPWLFVPLVTARGPIGVVGIAALKSEKPLDSEAKALFDTLAEQTAAALERASLSRDMVTTRSAAETERVRNTLLASVSHDFRTPLSSILGAATSLIEYGDKLEPDARRDLLGQIKDEAEALDDMVRNLLAITRIDAGALELRLDWIDLRDTAGRVVSRAKRHGAVQHFATRIPEGLPLVRADATLVEQALNNIVRNAVAHTPADTRIDIEATTNSDRLALTITDNGPGIPPTMLPHVFEKFIRGHDKQADGAQGTGLGLAIAKGIMEAHHGSITVASPTEQGRGTRVTMVFPHADASA
jgi:two-component system sensor histidine kinase KdpD